MNDALGLILLVGGTLFVVVCLLACAMAVFFREKDRK